MNEKNIYQRMSEVTIKISKVAKNLEVGEGKNQYKAVGEADVLKAVKPIEAECGIYSYPANRRIVKEAEYMRKSEWNGKVTERMNLFMRIETVYRFVNVDNPEEYIEIVGYGDGIDSQDKAPGKAMTYSDKYALLKAYKIQTGDDPDQSESEELKNPEPKKPTKKSEPVVKADADDIKTIKELLEATNVDMDNILEHYSIKKLEDMTKVQVAHCKHKLNLTLDKQNEPKEAE